MKQKKSVLLAGVFTVLGLGILLKLGFWQLDRHEWKTGLLAKIDVNMTAEPLTLNPLPETGNLEYRRVCGEGTFFHDKELYFFSTNLQGEGGYHVYTPFLIENGKVFFVNRGWVPPGKKEPQTRLESRVPGTNFVCGVLRNEGQKAYFTPENNPSSNSWFYTNIEQIEAATDLTSAVDLLIDADSSPIPGGFPVGGQTKVELPNNHLGYAITWFGLALALLGVFTVFAIKAK